VTADVENGELVLVAKPKEPKSEDEAVLAESES
jgi:hypothetical protein